MTRDEYIALIEKRLKKWLQWSPDVASINRKIAEDLAAHIWSPMEVAKAVQELAVHSGLSFNEAMRSLGEFVSSDTGLDTIREFNPEDAAPPLSDTTIIQPGDRLVIRVPLNTSRDVAKRISDQISASLPGVQVTVIAAEGMAIYRGEPKTFLDLRTPERWLDTDYKGYQILDPDGWRGKRKLDWRTPITKQDFYDRMMNSTIQAPIGDQKERRPDGDE
jgi:hypothetical protein